MTQITESDVRSAILAELSGRLEERGLAPDELPDDFDLLAEGVIDSFGVLELIGSIEERFGLAVDFEELEATDLTSIGPFSRYVAGEAETSHSNGRAPVEPEAQTPAEQPPVLAADGLLPGSRPLRRGAGRASLAAYRSLRRARNKLLSLLWSGSFAAFGPQSVIESPVRLSGESRIAIGSNVYIGSDSWLQAFGDGDAVVLRLGDRVSVAGHCVFSAVHSIWIGDAVSFARGVYVSDHAHAYRDVSRAILDQGIEGVEAVEIGDGAWIGENAVILPGTRIGRGAVIAANSVVSGNVPAHAVAAGIPARVISRFS
jgi:acetyltransferase-like isoleucine patch superfamily enzyme/acyl carrier protein